MAGGASAGLGPPTPWCPTSPRTPPRRCQPRTETQDEERPKTSTSATSHVPPPTSSTAPKPSPSHAALGPVPPSRPDHPLQAAQPSSLLQRTITKQLWPTAQPSSLLQRTITKQLW